MNPMTITAAADNELCDLLSVGGTFDRKVEHSS